MSDLPWRLFQVAGFGWTAFRAENPTWVIITAMLPRVALQSLFIALLAQVVAGTDPSYALPGAIAVVITLSSAVAVMDVPLSDKWSGTFHRVRSGRLPVFLVFVLRSWPYVLLSMVFVLVATVVSVICFRTWALGVDLVIWSPMYVLMSATTCAAGLAGAALAAGRNADIIAGNLLSYLILLCGGVIVRPGQLAWVEPIGAVLPITHGLAALRAGLAGRTWWAQALLEFVVGLAWLLAALLIVSFQARRARLTGHDDFV